MTDGQQFSQTSLFAVSDEKRENGTGTRGSRRAREPLTSKQQLNSTIKSVRDLLRKDSGLSGDTDRLPQLTWLLFLKNFDDFEYAQEEEQGDAYEPIIAHPYRWTYWPAVDARP